MTRSKQSQRIKADALSQAAAQGVARALEARESMSKTELTADEVEQVSGGILLNPEWLGIWPKEFRNINRLGIEPLIKDQFQKEIIRR